MNKTIRPFSDAGGFTAFRNEILDHVMPLCRPNTWKVVCCVLRATKGWQKEEDELSFSQIMRRTGIKSRPTANSSIQDALDNKFILRSPTEHSFAYKLNTSLEITLVRKVTQKPNSGVGAKPGGSVETKHTIDIDSKETQNNKEIIDSVFLRFFDLFDSDILLSKKRKVRPFEAIADNWNLIIGRRGPSKETPTRISKCAARWKSKEWRESYVDALQKASGSEHLMGSNWFKFDYFIRNDQKAEDILGGTFDSFDSQSANGRAPTNTTPSSAEIFAAARKRHNVEVD